MQPDQIPHRISRISELATLFVVISLTASLPGFAEFGCNHQLRALVRQICVSFAVASWLAFLPTLLPRQLFRVYAALLIFVTTTLCLFSLAHILIFGKHPTDAVFISIFNTHFAELAEFVDAYVCSTENTSHWTKSTSLSIRCAIYFSVFTLAHLLVFQLYGRLKNMLGQPSVHLIITKPLWRWLPGAPLLIMLGTLRLPCGIESAFRYSVYSPALLAIEYTRELAAVSSPPQSAIREQLRITLPTSNSTRPETFVLVIGEATNRNHLGIYNYYRDTTPNLSRLESELLIYRNAFSTHCHTHTSLKSALSFYDSAEPTPFAAVPSVIDLMNLAGFKTFWISNQVAFGRWNTPVSNIARQASVVRFLNPEQFKLGAKSYDEVVISPFAEALEDPAPRKFIVVHLRGTHVAYSSRYPETFEEFREAPISTRMKLDNGMKTIVNQYDTAVRYLDQVLGAMIVKLKSQNGYSNLLFFADHGEEVYDWRDFYGHNETIPSPFMFEIPFVIWNSKEYSRSNPQLLEAATANLAKEFVLNGLIDTIQDLTGIHSATYHSARSLFSDNYVPTPFNIGSVAENAESGLCSFR